MALAAQTQVSRNTKKRYRTYQVNFAQALSKMKHTLVALIHRLTRGIKELLAQTIDYISLMVEAVRGGRSYERRLSKQKNKRHCSSYKGAL